MGIRHIIPYRAHQRTPYHVANPCVHHFAHVQQAASIRTSLAVKWPLLSSEQVLSLMVFRSLLLRTDSADDSTKYRLQSTMVLVALEIFSSTRNI